MHVLYVADAGQNGLDVWIVAAEAADRVGDVVEFVQPADVSAPNFHRKSTISRVAEIK